MNEEQNIERIEALLQKGSFAQLSAEDRAFLLAEGIDEQAFRFLAQSMVPDTEPVPELPETVRNNVLAAFDAHAAPSPAKPGASSSANSPLRISFLKYAAVAAVSLTAVITLFFILKPNRNLNEHVALETTRPSQTDSNVNTLLNQPVAAAAADTLRNAANLNRNSPGEVYMYDYDASGAGITMAAPEQPVEFSAKQNAAGETDNDDVTYIEKTEDEKIRFERKDDISSPPSNTIALAEVQIKESNRLSSKDKENKEAAKGKKSFAYDSQDQNTRKKEEIAVSQSSGPGRTAPPQYPDIRDVADARYKGGYKAFEIFVSSNLRTPSSRSLYSQAENTVVMEIDIDPNGVIARRAVVSSPDAELTLAVNQLLDKLPAFGKGESVTVQVPFRFP